MKICHTNQDERRHRTTGTVQCDHTWVPGHWSHAAILIFHQSDLLNIQQQYIEHKSIDHSHFLL